MLRAVSRYVSTLQTKACGVALGDHAMRERGLHPQASHDLAAACPMRLRRPAAGGRWPVRPEDAGHEPINNSVGRAYASLADYMIHRQYVFVVDAQFHTTLRRARYSSNFRRAARQIWQVIALQ